MGEKKDILFLSGIDWSFSWQRHQQLATLFSRNHRVLFIEMALSPANLLTEGRNTFSHWASWRKGVREIVNNIHLYTCPPVLPFGRSSGMVNRLNQGLGLTDADKSQLEDKLKSGGAALVVMASDDEVQPTKAFLDGLNEGQVQDYQVPDDSAQKLEDAKDVPPPDTSDDDKADDTSGDNS